MPQKFATLIIDQTLSSILSPYGTKVCRIFLHESSRLRGFAGLAFSMNVIEAPFKKPIVILAGKMPKKVFLHAGFRTMTCNVIVFYNYSIFV